MSSNLKSVIILILFSFNCKIKSSVDFKEILISEGLYLNFPLNEDFIKIEKNKFLGQIDLIIDFEGYKVKVNKIEGYDLFDSYISRIEKSKTYCWCKHIEPFVENGLVSSINHNLYYQDGMVNINVINKDFKPFTANKLGRIIRQLNESRLRVEKDHNKISAINQVLDLTDSIRLFLPDNILEHIKSSTISRYDELKTIKYLGEELSLEIHLSNSLNHGNFPNYEFEIIKNLNQENVEILEKNGFYFVQVNTPCDRIIYAYKILSIDNRTVLIELKVRNNEYDFSASEVIGNFQNIFVENI